MEGNSQGDMKFYIHLPLTGVYVKLDLYIYIDMISNEISVCIHYMCRLINPAQT